MKDKIRVGIFGNGKMGNIRKNILENDDRFDVVFVYDSGGKKCSVAEKIRLSRIEAVFVCVYPVYAPSIVIEALKQNMYVFCEKPPGTSLDDVIDMQVAESESKGKIKFGFNHRYHPSIAGLKSDMDIVNPKDINYVRAVYGKAGELSHWRNIKKKAGGGILLDQGIHMIDLMLYLFGDISLKGAVVRKDTKSGLDVDVMALFEQVESGAPISLHSSASIWDYRFCLEISRQEQLHKINGLITPSGLYEPEKLELKYRHSANNPPSNLKHIKSLTTVYSDDFSFEKEIDEFYDIICGSEQYFGTVTDAMKVMGFIDEIYNS